MTHQAQVLEQLRLNASVADQLPWFPANRPQLDALNSTADVLLYGGAAGGGKTELLIGMALLRGKHSLLLRREFKQLQAIQNRLTEIFKGRANYVAGEQTWRFPDGRTLELGSCPNLADVEKYQGRPHDILMLDEACHFAVAQVEFLQGWLRSADGRPCRLVMASNPPMSSEGIWLLDYFRPWLDPNHPNPARPGETRWFARVDGVSKEVDEGYPGALSRQFIPSKLSDNPYLSKTDYESRLRSLPPELANALLNGDFMGAGGDKPLQVVPSTWVRAAQSRWRPDCDLPITAIGVDAARGGRDRCVIAVRRRNHVDKPIILQPHECKTGGAVAARVLDIMGDSNARVRVDVIGVGSSVYDHLHPYLGHLVEPVTANAAPRAGGSGKYANRRAQDFWALREQLDPASSVLELPPSSDLYAELSAPEYSINARGIIVESKEHLIKRLGRSPDIGDAVVLACAGV